MQVWIRSPKQTLSVRVDIYLDRSYNNFCPVASMMAYPTTRGDATGQWETHNKGTVGWQAPGDPMLHWYSQIIHSGHSFRIGAATTAVHHGIPDATIQLPNIGDRLEGQSVAALDRINPHLDYSAKLVRIRPPLRYPRAVVLRVTDNGAHL